jgi:hypothetical protein
MTHCPSCGSATASAAEFCRRCGNDLTSPGLIPPINAREDTAERTVVIDTDGRSDVAGTLRPARRPRRLAGVLVAVLGLGLLGAGGFAGYHAFVQNRTPAAANAGQGSNPPPVSATAGPTTGSNATATATVSGTGPLVAAAPALAARPETAAVVQLLTRYFSAINNRDFRAARATLVRRDGLPANDAEFQDQYRSTHDEDVRLLGLSPTDSGGYLATVSFTSYQNPADAPDKTSSCLIWSVSYPLVQVDGTLLIDVVGRSEVTYRHC